MKWQWMIFCGDVWLNSVPSVNQSLSHSLNSVTLPSEVYLQKIKHRYQNTRSLTTKLNLSQMSTELQLRPPYIVQGDDLGLKDNCAHVSYRESYRPTGKLIICMWFRILLASFYLQFVFMYMCLIGELYLYITYQIWAWLEVIL